MRRTALTTEAWWYRSDTAAESFEDAVRAACASHERRGLGRATHCSVDPREPGLVGRVDGIQILINSRAGLGSFCAHREDGR